MDFQSKLQVFLVFFVMAIACQTWRANADSTLEEDRDALVQFNDVLSGLAHSITETSNELKSGVTEGEQDVGELMNVESRMTYEVQVMRLEQDAEVLSGKRTANSAEKEQQITEAEKNLTETLAPKIAQVAQDLVDLNTTMSQTTLKDEDLQELIKKANANLTEDEQIVIPTSGEIMGNVSAEINKVRPIFERRASTQQMQIIEKHLTSIRTNFERLLNDDSQAGNLENMADLSVEIDTSLTQIRQLNVLDSQARMEL